MFFATGGIFLIMSRGKPTRHERLIHHIDELVDVAERQLLILVGTSDAFEEVKPFRPVLNRDLIDVKSDAFICGKIRFTNSIVRILNLENISFIIFIIFSNFADE